MAEKLYSGVTPNTGISTEGRPRPGRVRQPETGYGATDTAQAEIQAGVGRQAPVFPNTEGQGPTFSDVPSWRSVDAMRSGGHPLAEKLGESITRIVGDAYNQQWAKNPDNDAHRLSPLPTEHTEQAPVDPTAGQTTVPSDGVAGWRSRS